MGKKSRKKREDREGEASMPPGCFQCSKCGRPWLKTQAFPHKEDVLCYICHESFLMALEQAAYEVAEAEFLLRTEAQKHARKN